MGVGREKVGDLSHFQNTWCNTWVRLKNLRAYHCYSACVACIFFGFGLGDSYFLKNKDWNFYNGIIADMYTKNSVRAEFKNYISVKLQIYTVISNRWTCSKKSSSSKYQQILSISLLVCWDLENRAWHGYDLTSCFPWRKLVSSGIHKLEVQSPVLLWFYGH